MCIKSEKNIFLKVIHIFIINIATMLKMIGEEQVPNTFKTVSYISG